MSQSSKLDRDGDRVRLVGRVSGAVSASLSSSPKRWRDSVVEAGEGPACVEWGVHSGDSVNQVTDDVLEANGCVEEFAELIGGAPQLRVDLDGGGCFAEFAECDAVNAALVRAATPSCTLREIESAGGEALSRVVATPSIGDAHSTELGD